MISFIIIYIAGIISGIALMILAIYLFRRKLKTKKIKKKGKLIYLSEYNKNNPAKEKNYHIDKELD